MQLREEHSGLYYITRGGESAQGKSKVYFCSTKVDKDRFFEEICADIFKYRPECAIFFVGEDDLGFTEERQEVLAEMQLFVMPVSSELLTKENTALSLEYPFANEHKIPVLPLVQEQGLEDIFNYKCGELQFLDKHANDATAISYDDKLKKYLESVLIGDEMSKKIRAAFDAYIFLSYRKKDRKQAQSLMRLIHENEDFQDIAIWYDEFLVPGENFNHAIEDALNKCDVFTLLVTPNLVNEPNYVQQQEYPAAVKSQKPILPVEAEKTERVALETQYPDIPLCVEPKIEHLSEEMHSCLNSIALGENNNDPMHLFFMGLAYLSGIDVERNPERAERLLGKSADLGLPEACGKLSDMYKNGEGVKRNYGTAALWLEKKAQILKEKWKKKQTVELAYSYFNCLWELGNAWYNIARLDKAKETYIELLTVANFFKENSVDYQARRCLSISYEKLGHIAKANSKYVEAEEWYKKSLEIDEKLSEEIGAVDTKRDLSISYINLGDMARLNGKLEEAKKFYSKCLSIRTEISMKTGTVESKRDLIVPCCNLGNIAEINNDFEKAELWYKMSIAMALKLVIETGNVESRSDLVHLYNKLGNIAKAKENLEEAEAWYNKGMEVVKGLVYETETIKSRRGLFVSYDKMGSIAEAKGKLEEAEIWYKKSLEIIKELEVQTKNVKLRSDLAYSYDRMGNIAEKKEKLEEAELWYKKGLELKKVLENEDEESRRSLFGSYNRIGGIAKAKGNLEEAESCYMKAMELCRGLADEKGTEEVRRVLMYSYNYLAVVTADRGNIGKSEWWSKKCMDTLKELVVETGNVEYRKYLITVYRNLGNIALRKQKLEESETWYKKSLNIAEELAKETGTVEFRNILSNTYNIMGDIAKANRKLNEAAKWYRKGFEMSYAENDKVSNESIVKKDGFFSRLFGSKKK